MKKVLSIFASLALACAMFVIPVNAEGNVAKIGDNEYSTLMEAFSAAKEGDTVTLIDDIIVNKSTYATKSITIDLAGHTIKNESKGYALYLYASKSSKNRLSITLKNGTLINMTDKSTNSALTVGSNVDLVLDNVVLSSPNNGFGLKITEGSTDEPTVIINGENTNISGSVAGIGIYHKKNSSSISQITVNNGIIEGGYGIAGNGLYDGTSVTINGGTIRSTSADGAAIYYPQDGDLTINGGTIEGANGIQYCGTGKVSITGGKIIATADSKELTYKDSDGNIDDGAALSIVSRNGYGTEGTTDVSITGGTFISNNNVAIREYANGSVDSIIKSLTIGGSDLKVIGASDKNAVELGTLTGDKARVISSGTFSSDVQDYILENKVEIKIESKNVQDLYYIGTTSDIKNIIESTVVGGDIVTILQKDKEDLVLDNMPIDVTIKNVTNDTIIVNNQSLNDGEQITIKAPEISNDHKPSETEKPSESKPAETAKPTDSKTADSKETSKVKTGDDTNVSMYALTGTLALTIIAAIYLGKKRKQLN